LVEIDLIPSDYRLAQRRDRALHTLARVAGALLVTGIAAAGSLAYAASRVHAELGELTLAQRLSEQQRTELEHLDAERVRLEQQLQRLEALRGGGDIGALFRLIDRTLPAGELWFERWELLRTGQEGRPGGAAVATPAAAAATPPSTAMAGRQMRIFGQARDHAALSRFVRELYESPEVDDVHLERTTLRRYTTTSVVAFELAVALKDAA
jgi:Tfp pilus assembly protein PilN